MKPTVVILDHSLTVRMDLQEAFAAAGYQAIPCATLGAARRELAEGPCDLLVLEAHLPDAASLSWLAELRATAYTAELPVILLAPEAEAADHLVSLDRAADAVFAKPHDLKQLLACASRLLAPPDGTARRSGQATVLVIDDSRTFREELREMLVSAGYHVILAASGEDGLRLAATLLPDAAVIDGEMEGLDGYAVMRRLRLESTLKHLPCILLTASETYADEVKALAAGADVKLHKGCKPTLITARLAALLRSSRNVAPIPFGPGAFAPIRLLAVDDSVSYLEELRANLVGEGYVVLTASSGEQAMAFLEKQLVDCILLDLVMPGLSGPDTCRLIKARPLWREIPLAIISAADHPEAIIDGLNAGADDYILKSHDFEVLKGRLRAQLRRKRNEDENRRLHAELLRTEVAAAEARGIRELAETRAGLLADLEHKNLELAAARDQAEAANATKSAFLATMSHELRTPLNSIIGYTELVLRSKRAILDELSSSNLAVVLRNGKHLLALINDILDLSKVEAGMASVYAETLDPNLLVRGIASTTEALAHEKGLVVAVFTDPSLGLVVTDQTKVRQIVLNLVSNAIKFTQNGRITIEVGPRPGDRWAVVVEDTGIGIASEHLALVFDEFKQVDASTTRVAGGTGLGLAIARRLARLLGGDLSVSSEPGRGSRFTLELPIGQIVERPQTISPTVPSTPSNAVEVGADGLLPVITIDDDPEMLTLIAERLKGSAYRAVPATTGDSGIRLARKIKPVAITLDIILPGKDGWTVLRELKNDPATADIPVLILSVTENRLLGYSLGAAGYLTKPISQDDLIETLDRVGPVARQGQGYVLVIDDDPEARGLYEALLAGRGVRCSAVASGQEGLDAIDRECPALVILDLMMPRMSGFEVIASIRSHEATREVPVVIVTAKELTDDDRNRLAAAQAILCKGVTAEQALVDQLQALLGTRDPGC